MDAETPTPSGGTPPPSSGPLRRARIFASYGRRDTRDLADRLRRDLETLGYQVWQDTEQILSGQDWIDKIEQALRDSEIVIALLSPHSVRVATDPKSPDALDSVCLNEITYARFTLKALIVPVMAIHCEVPFVICHLDYVDFQGWQESEERYQAGLQRLIQSMQDTLISKRVPYRRWHERLTPFDFEPYLNEKRQNFTGRQWLFDEIEAWRVQDNQRTLLITGDPGTGKSAFVAELVFRNPENQVLAYHCCQAENPATLDLGQFIRSITAMIASRIPAYVAVIEQPGIADALEQLQIDTNPQHAFYVGVVASLARLPAPEGGVRYLLIDALDEAMLGGRGGVTIVDLLEPYLRQFPPWLRVVATTRKERTVLDRLSGLRAQTIDAHDPRNLADIEAFIQQRLTSPKLAQLVQDAAARGVTLEHITATLCDKAAGNFLYARQALHSLEEGTDTFTNLEALPKGLNEFYQRFFQRHYPPGTERYTIVRTLLEVVVAAREPLTAQQLAEAAGLSLTTEVAPALRTLSGYLAETEGRYAPFHKSLSDWLTDPQRGTLEYLIDPRHGRERLFAYCRRWRDLDDAYPLVHLSAYLCEAGQTDELKTLLLEGSFSRRKAERLNNAFLEIDDFRYLITALLRDGRDSEVTRLAVTEDPYQRDGVVAALCEASPGIQPRIEVMVEQLLQEGASGRWPLFKKAELPPAVLNARRVAIRVAQARAMDHALERVATDSAGPVRAIVVPYLYRFWKEHPEAGWHLLERLNTRMLRSVRRLDNDALEVIGGFSMAILSQHFAEPETMTRLRAQWQRVIHHSLRLPLLKVVSNRLVLSVLTQVLKIMMARQPDFQPLNLKEMTVSVAREPAFHEPALDVLLDLERPERGFARTVEVLLQRDVPYDVHLMMVAERSLIYHGWRDPGGVLAALERIHQEGLPWFCASILYVAFHVLDKATTVPDPWLERYAALTRDIISSTRATLKTDVGLYVQTPQMAWIEAVFERHRPTGKARFIPEFFAEALRLADFDYVGRVISACDILAMVYHRRQVALDALQPAVTAQEPRLRTRLIEVLANIRFYAESAVDRFLADQPQHDLARHVAAAAPTVKAADFPTWIDEFMNYSMIHSDEFRLETVGAFRRAAAARSIPELFHGTLAWGINLIAGEQVVAPE